MGFDIQIHNSRNFLIAVAFFILLATVICTNSWVVDDAYITFRTVDNFVHGYGLTWNTDERVQAYTHPLWMFVLSLSYVITLEFFFTVLVLSCILTLAAVITAWATVTDQFRHDVWKGCFLVLSIMASKAVMDYASSGLENCMSYLIAAAFLSRFLHISKTEQIEEGRLFSLFLLVSLAFCNRADTLLLYIPALLYLLYLSRLLPRWHLARIIFVASIPAVGWLLFSMIYYGYPSPNTAYAKVICPGLPFEWKLHRGVEYMINSIHWDSMSYVIMASAGLIALKSRSIAAISVITGVILYIGFVLTSAASATHMSGRFLAVPFFIAFIVAADVAPNRRFAVWACACLVAFMAWSPVSAVKFGTELYHPYPQNLSYLDTKWYVLQQGAALLNWRPGIQMPDHDYYRYGETLRYRPERVIVGGAHGREAIGYTGFAASHTKHFVDRVALSDPLLSKLPAYRPAHLEEWISGHFHRRIPEGYIESLITGTNVIHNADLRTYYGYVRVITRDPIWSWDRFRVIMNMNLGRYDYLLQQVDQGTEDDGVTRAP